MIFLSFLVFCTDAAQPIQSKSCNTSVTPSRMIAPDGRATASVARATFRRRRRTGTMRHPGQSGECRSLVRLGRIYSAFVLSIYAVTAWISVPLLHGGMNEVDPTIRWKQCFHAYLSFSLGALLTVLQRHSTRLDILPGMR